MANQNIELNQLQEQETEGSRPSTASSPQPRDNDQQSLSYSSDEDISSAREQQQQSARGLAQSMSAIALGNHPRLLTPTNPLIMRRVHSGPDTLIPKQRRSNSPPLSPSRRGGSLKHRSGLGASSIGKGSKMPNGFQDFQSELKSLHKQLTALTSSK
jgi:hypothetical protein